MQLQKWTKCNQRKTRSFTINIEWHYNAVYSTSRSHVQTIKALPNKIVIQWSARIPISTSNLRPKKGLGTHTHTHTHTTVLWLCGFCPGQPGWAGTRRHIHPLTLIVVINHPYQLSPSTTTHGIFPIQSTYFTVFFHNLSPSFLWSTSWPGLCIQEQFVNRSTNDLYLCLAILIRILCQLK